jgi:hypothetical protein
MDCAQRSKSTKRKTHSHRGAPDERLFAYNHEMFAHIAEYRTVFRALAGKQSGSLIRNFSIRSSWISYETI